jgi:lipopolysaccharide biosynthesis glycosyltransferase
MMINANSDFLYLDVDLLLQNGWDDLVHLSPDPGVAVMGVEDAWLKHLGTTHESMYGNFYFNTGVLLYFSKAWVDNNLSDHLLAMISRIDNSELHIRDSLFDQDILNIVCANNKMPLDRTYNSFIIPYANAPVANYHKLGREFQPKIIHYISHVKPFKDLGDLKFEILKMGDSNANLGYIDSTHHFYYLYYFVQNQRLLWELNS